jgi:2-succinyl-5-enolpyruvyl-6-hydroxy-3-cyclohexene-1-carboxylate synthase
MNPATAFAVTLADELARCGLAEAVIAPGSRSAPLALAFWEQPRVRVHVRIDERSAGFCALGLAKASGRPVAVVCTSGTAAANLHAPVVEAGEAAVPLLVLTADRPPELRGTGANQAIDQLKLYGGAVRWFCETGVPEARPGMNGYWRSLACRAWAAAAGAGGGLPGPVHLNVALREPLVPGLPDHGAPGPAGHAMPGPGAAPVQGWPEPLDGRPGGEPWTRFPGPGTAGAERSPGSSRLDGRLPGGSQPAWQPPGTLELPWAERGVVVCGDGSAAAGPLLRMARQAGWPVLAEPGSGARRGPNALAAYQYLLAAPEFLAAHSPEVIVSAGRPGTSRQQLAFLRQAGLPGGPARHVVVADGPGHWADPARTATDVAGGIRLAGVPDRPGRSGWLGSWLAADAAARDAVDRVLDAGPELSEPRLARDLAATLPDGALLWAASSLPIRDLDHHMAPRAGLRVLASRGASGIDGLVSAAIGAALAHQRAGGGPSAALLGDLAFLHDLPGLLLGPDEPRPDLTLVVVNNNGGGIFSLLEPAALGAPFERLFATPHRAGLRSLAAGAGLRYQRLERAAELGPALAGAGLRVLEVPADRAAGASLRARLHQASRDALAARLR